MKNSNWINVDDDRPRIIACHDTSELVLVSNKDGYDLYYWYSLGNYWITQDGYKVDSTSPITHWMLLPELPK